MSVAEKDALLILKLFDLLEALEKRLAEFERKVEKTSRNSGKPPSSDGLKRQSAEYSGPQFQDSYLRGWQTRKRGLL